MCITRDMTGKRCEVCVCVHVHAHVSLTDIDVHVHVPGDSPEAPASHSNGHSLSARYWVKVRVHVATECLVQLVIKGTYRSKNDKKKILLG